ncbi:MAG: hypothetical protein LR008_00660 [Candidatus Pacebacteria bacterium]|nr:hypothetical protein [Candidatus Paceibacterota bacterium]
MKGQINPKIVGATIVGFALVAGAYVTTNFGEPSSVSQNAAIIDNSATSPRVSIEVVDNDQNGIEDWRDEFVTASPVVLNNDSEEYTTPETLTGEMSIDFMENIIRSRGYGAFGSSEEEIINKTVSHLEEETAQTLYDINDIIIMSDWSDQDIVNYANTVGATILRHSIAGMDSEAVILKDVLSNNNTERLSELEDLVGVYKGYRDDTIKIPVPSFMIKEHLDLINTYNAIYVDVSAMLNSLDDPVVALLRLRRYQDDATALGYAMQNMYFLLADSPGQYEDGAPATIFTIFSPDYQI